MLLKVWGLQAGYHTDKGLLRAVDGVSFELEHGQILGLVGESGCGKTTVVKCLMRLLPWNGRIINGNIVLDGVDLAKLSEVEMRQVRWKRISMIPQSAMNALDPIYRVGDQVTEAILAHEPMPKIDASKRAEELFDLVGIEGNRLRDFPHQLSGGMKQRVCIAMALASNPDLLLADEPTTGLDVVVQDRILGRLDELRKKLGISIMLVTHDIAVVAEMCDKLAVMYGGKIVESGSTRDVLKKPLHPYTMGLRNAFPNIRERRERFISIPGNPPNLLSLPQGCRFADRCPFATNQCREVEPPLLEVDGATKVSCHYWSQAEDFRARTSEETTWVSRQGEVMPPAPKSQRLGPVLLEINNVKRNFPLRQGLIAALFRGVGSSVRAVDGLSIKLRESEILGLAGESGAGKSTLGEVCVRLQPLDDGRIVFAGTDVSRLEKKRMKWFRSQVQMIFQDPYETLNPRFTVFETVAESLKILGVGDENERFGRVKESLGWAGLRPADNYLNRYPHELSGGERQRVAIARAIAIKPRLIVADEPVSMLDVSIRAGILELLKRMRDELGMTMIYISHDLSTIKDICDRTAIMYLGRVVEIGPTDAVIRSPKHPYTRKLVAAIPVPDPEAKRPRVQIQGDIPNASDLPLGCRFRPRCDRADRLCGWEAKDLMNMIRYRGGQQLMNRIGVMRCHGRILDVETRERPQELERTILNLIRESPLEKALSGSSIKGQHLILTFLEAEEPTLLPVGVEHFAACYYAQG